MRPPRNPQASLQPWTDPVWRATTPEAQKQQLAHAYARRVMVSRRIQDPDVERALVQMTAWVETLAAADQGAEQEDDEPWVSTVVAEDDGYQRRSRLALLGTVVFVLGVLCVVALAALRLR